MAASSTLLCGTGADSSAVGSYAWANPSRITAADLSYATDSGGVYPGGQSHYLQASNFGFSVPSTATIAGVLVQMYGYQSNYGKGNAWQQTANLIVSGTVTASNRFYVGPNNTNSDPSNTSTTYQLPTSASLMYLGGTTSLWANMLTPSIVNASNFGFSWSIKQFANTSNVDYVKATVYYSTLTKPVSYVGSGSAALGSSSTSITLSAPSGLQAGDTMLASIGYNSTTGVPSSAPSGWTDLGGAAGAFSGTYGIHCYSKVATSGDVGSSFTWGFGASPGGTGIYSMIAAYRNVQSVGTAKITGTGAGSSFTTGSVTPQTDSDWAAAFTCNANYDPAHMTWKAAAWAGGASNLYYSLVDECLPSSSASGTRTWTPTSTGAVAIYIPLFGTPNTVATNAPFLLYFM